MTDSNHPTNLLLAQVRQAGVVVEEDPTRTRLEEHLAATRLLKFPAPPDSTFCLYWSGHGLMNHVTRQRLLLTSDAVAGAYTAINVEDQTNFLRLEPRLQNFSRVVAIVDACSRWTRPDVAVTALALPLSHLSEQGRQQERVYASTNGDVAVIPAGATLSQFTAHLLQALPSDTEVSVDLDAVWEKMKRSLGATGKPFLVWRFLPDGREDSLTGGDDPARPARTAALGKILEGSAAFTLESLQRNFRAVTHCDADTKLPVSSRELVERISSFAAVDTTLSNVERFALRLEQSAVRRAQDATTSPADRQKFQTLAAALKTWLQDSDQPAVVQERAHLETERRLPMQLFIDLGRGEVRVWTRIAEKWKFVGRLPNAGNAVEQIKQALRSAIEAGLATRNCHLEVAVSLEALADLPIGADLSTLPGRQLRIGTDLPVTLRIRDRWSDMEQLNNWQDNWEASRKYLQRAGCLDWLDKRPPAEIDCIPQPNAWISLHDLDSELWRNRLLVHVHNGAPWALACRPAVEDAFRTVLEQYAATYALEEWMELAKKVAAEIRRCAASASAPNVAQSVLLLADAPTQLPPGAADRLSLPDIVG